MLRKLLNKFGWELDYDILDTYLERGKDGHLHTKHIKKWKLVRKNAK